MRIKDSVFTLLAGLFLSASAHAQELRLFEEPEGEAQPGLPMAPDQAFTQGSGQPSYTLRSISRFGDRYHAVLINSSGQVSQITWKAGEAAQVLSSGGFSIAAAGPGTLSLQHPPGSNCVAAVASGVQCSAPDRSELKLVPSAPLASNGVMPQPVGPQQDAGFFQDPFGLNGAVDPAMQQNANGEQVFINPFSGQPEVMPPESEADQLARQQRQEMRAARLRQFEEQAPTIDPANVPPGMRVVRTPFGDRMVPVRD